jgi:hypothetical protein
MSNNSILEYVQSQLLRLEIEIHQINHKEALAKQLLSNVNEERKYMYKRGMDFKKLVKAKPEILDDPEIKTSYNIISYFVEGYERDEKESPVARLLEWSSLSGPIDESFILSQSYEVLGKDDARTLRALLREVIMLIDHKLAYKL